MNKDQYKESCGRIGVPFFEEDFNEKMQDYIKSIQAMAGGDGKEVKPPDLVSNANPVEGLYIDEKGQCTFFRGKNYWRESCIEMHTQINTTLNDALDFLDDKPEDYNVIDKPKHYMLFEDKNIEVRDVIEKLVAKVDKQMGEGVVPYSPLFSSDYTQMMQYGMRFMEKNGKQDLEKMQWYLSRLIDSYDRAA
jgi:hypothetical protein